MGWADDHIRQLQLGWSVSFQPRGHSMAGIIEDNQLVTVAPYRGATLKIGDVVLCAVADKQYLHLIKAIRHWPLKYQIGNNKGGSNGWIWPNNIYGVLT